MFYAEQKELDFHDLASKLASAMLHASEGGLEIRTEYDDVIIFDQADVRIGLAYGRLASDFPEVLAAQGCDECFIVSVGERPDGIGRADHAEICARMAAQIESRYPADGEVVLESDAAFNETTFDDLLDETVAAFLETTEPEAPVQPARAEIFGPDDEAEHAAPAHLKLVARDEPPRQRGAEAFEPVPEDWVPSDLIARYDREQAQRGAPRAAMRYEPPRRRPTAAANTPGAPARATAAARPRGERAAAAFSRLRPQPTHAAAAADHMGAKTLARAGIHIGGLEPETGSIFPPIAAAHAAPLVHRGAINALNVAVMAFSLPMGAFLMTLALLGRESLVMSSRVTAATGAGIGVTQSDTALQILQSFIS
ncbi:hypothetical protein [Sinisalibacter aestuarii]|uniref:hypothetical protein n=1 Tax=Sinisalibacter aestuarii TaxID=2949426 RepID=UPI002492A069|nr:hypothetical protein [Sinisalibacter aestuarii]